jgi:hypothetical protein
VEEKEWHMSVSHIIRIPDFAELRIPAVNYTIKLSDKTVFKTVLDQHRKVVPVDGPAQKGDYVLTEVSFGAREPKRLHVELGGRHFPDLEAALMGCHPGQALEANINDETSAIQILSVARPVEMKLTNENIEKLGLPGIHNKNDYRQNYVALHGEEISGRAFSALHEKLLAQLTELIEVELDPAEVDAFNQQQKKMIDKITGNAEERLLLAYGDHGTHSLAECEALFAADNRKSFIWLLLGHALAQRDHKQISPEERTKILSYYTAVWEKNETEIEAEGLMETALEPFYLQYTVESLKAYYQSLVRFQTELS